MDSEESTVDTKEYPQFSYPELQLYEMDEYEARCDEWQMREDKVDLETPKNYWQTYRSLRFFCSVRGFFTGSLDLTGRHWLRCVSLMTRWIEFVSEFNEISLNATPFEYEETDRWGNRHIYVDYTLNVPDTDIWPRFQEKWCMPFSYGGSLSWTNKVLNAMAEHPMVKIQKLCLLDLPVELLDNIMSVTASDLSKARLLSSTCRHLRNVGLRYILGERTLSIEHDSDWERVRWEDDQTPYLHDLALRARAKLLSTTQFLLSRPDLTRSLRNLFIINHWSPMMLIPLAQDFDITTVEPAFYFPILQDIGRVLYASHNLAMLVFIGIDIRADFLRTISQFENLHSVKYRGCQIAPDDQAIIVAGQVPVSQTILNLELVMDEHDSWSQWHTLPLCPQLRTLSVRGSSNFTFQNPAESIWQRCNPFQTLERFHLHYFDFQHVPQLTARLRAAATGHELRLTHFKLHTKWGTSDSEVFELLDALHTAPLQALALDGLRDGEVELIDRIAQTFPNLLGLTLVRRHNDRQGETGLSLWPHPSWVYAPHFASFSRLCHFGWNFKCQTLDPTPSVMIQFENDFAGCDSVGLRSRNEEDHYFRDDRLMALPFAAHCTTLQTFVIVDTFVGCWISRTPSGRLQIDDDTGPFSKIVVLERPWNPSSYTTWPTVLPVRNLA